MSKLVRSLYAGAALSMPLIFTVTTPAVAANVDTAVIQGSGTISPGLGLTPSPQSISFTGTATVVGTDGVLATYSCAFNGTDPAGSTAAGSGNVSGACGPLAFASCTFVRVGAHVDVVCTGGAGTGGAYAKCVFRAHSVLPTTSYDLTCKAEVALVP